MLALFPESRIDIEVKLDDVALTAAELQALNSLELRESVDRSAAVTLTFTDGDDQRLVGDRRFRVGAVVTVALGAPAKRTTSADVTRIRAELRPDGGTALTLEAYGRRLRLDRATRNRRWENMSDDAIAKMIAQEHHLDFRGASAPSVHERIDQIGQTDLEFLRDRAAALGLDLWVEERTLYFAPLESRDPVPVRIARDEVLGLESVLDVDELIDEVQVGWRDQVAGQQSLAVVSTPATIGPAATINDIPDGLSALLGPRSVWLDRVGASSEAEARTAAQIRLKQGRKGALVVTATCRGRPDLRIGTRVILDGRESIVPGELLVCDVVHTISSEAYQTNFTARRPA